LWEGDGGSEGRGGQREQLRGRICGGGVGPRRESPKPRGAAVLVFFLAEGKSWFWLRRRRWDNVHRGR